MLCPFPDPLPKFPDSRPCLSSPRKRGPREARTGKQGQNPRETRSTRTSRIWVPAFAGMTKSAIVFWPQCEKLIKNLPTNSFKEPKKSGINGDKSGLIVLTVFLHSGLNAIPLSVIPVFARMTKGRSVGKFESQERKKINLLHSHLRIEPFEDFCKRFWWKMLLTHGWKLNNSARPIRTEVRHSHS